MSGKIKRAFLFLLQPKAIPIGLALSLLLYVRDAEAKMIDLVGCYDCWWFSRQALLLFIASVGLLISRLWSLLISLLLSLMVVYSVGKIAFWNNISEVTGAGRILKESLRWSYDTHPELFVEISVAVLISLCAATYLSGSKYRKHMYKRTGI